MVQRFWFPSIFAQRDNQSDQAFMLSYRGWSPLDLDVNYFRSAFGGTARIAGWIVGTMSLTNMTVRIFEIGLRDVFLEIFRIYRLIFHFPFKFLPIEIWDIAKDSIILYLVFGGIFLRIISSSLSSIRRTQIADVRDSLGGEDRWRSGGVESLAGAKTAIYLPFPFWLTRSILTAKCDGSSNGVEQMRVDGTGLLVKVKYELLIRRVAQFSMVLLWPVFAFFVLRRPKILSAGVVRKGNEEEIRLLSFNSGQALKEIEVKFSEDDIFRPEYALQNPEKSNKLTIEDSRILLLWHIFAIFFGTIAYIATNFFVAN